MYFSHTTYKYVIYTSKKTIKIFGGQENSVKTCDKSSIYSQTSPDKSVVNKFILYILVFDECESDPCGRNSIRCIHSINNYTCECSIGWTGRNCEISKPLTWTWTNWHCFKKKHCLSAWQQDYFWHWWFFRYGSSIRTIHNAIFLLV